MENLLDTKFPYADNILKGKTALVCGASKGIGRATALMLARAGAQVIACARSPNELELLSEVEPTNDRIDETLNYDLIYKEIKKISSSQHFNLVETLTYRIFIYLKKLKKVSDLRISVSKHDIYEDCIAVGYEISTF